MAQPSFLRWLQDRWSRTWHQTNNPIAVPVEVAMQDRAPDDKGKDRDAPRYQPDPHSRRKINHADQQAHDGKAADRQRLCQGRRDGRVAPSQEVRLPGSVVQDQAVAVRASTFQLRADHRYLMAFP